MLAFQLLNFGCRASQADGAAIKKQLLDSGLRETEDLVTSQVAILNTCTVTATADAEIRQLIRRIHRTNPQCRILVTGCYAQRSPAELAKLEGVAWIIGNSHKHLIASLLSSELPEELVLPRSSPTKANESGRKQLVQIQKYANAGAASGGITALGSATPHGPTEHPTVLVGRISDEFHFAPAFTEDRTRPTLKIQDGCNARCSFCVIPSVRGRSRSLETENLINEVRELEQRGYREIVLSGINLGSYGRDLNPRTTFLGLIERLLDETVAVRFRISSIEPMDVSPRLIRLVATEPRLARHFHVPLQSGSDRILRLMNRRYWTTQYAERLLAIREQIPDAGIGADVMVGFPGETSQDHAASVAFIESLPLTYVHVFPFSARPDTPAAASPQQVNGRVARERGREIRTLVARKKHAFLLAQTGYTLSAVTLSEFEAGGRVALSSNYLKIILPGTGLPPNQLLNILVDRVHNDVLVGSPA